MSKLVNMFLMKYLTDAVEAEMLWLLFCTVSQVYGDYGLRLNKRQQ